MRGFFYDLNGNIELRSLLPTQLKGIQTRISFIVDFQVLTVRGIKSTKNSDWRNAYISSDLEGVLIELKNERGNEEFVLPHLTGWDGGYAGTILRNFLKNIGIEKYVNFHTLRACFATHVLASGAEPT